MNKLQFTLGTVADWVQRTIIGEEADRMDLGLVCLYGNDVENFSYGKSNWVSRLRSLIPAMTTYNSMSHHKSLFGVLGYVEHELGYVNRPGAKTYVFVISHSTQNYGFGEQASARQVGRALAGKVRDRGGVFVIDIDFGSRSGKPALADFGEAVGQGPILLRAFSQLSSVLNEFSDLIHEARMKRGLFGGYTAPITYAIAIDTAKEMYMDKTNILVGWQPKETIGGVVCPACEGAGRDVCPECSNFRPHGGSSVMWDATPGHGFVKCRRCDGWGFDSRDSCPICHGRGHLNPSEWR